MISVGIAGGAGYTAGELLRLLLLHPEVGQIAVQSRSQAGKPIHAVHTDLLGETDLLFLPKLEAPTDVLFLCGGHGSARELLAEIPTTAQTKIIDLSQDFRLHTEGNDFVYGLPELNREQLRTACRIANPGCFATAIQLALLPLAAQGLLKHEVHIHAVTGSTGAGQQPSGTTHFSWRNNNISIYKAFNHQHLKEIRQSLNQLQPGFAQSLNFIPVRGNFTRGIMATAYTQFSADLPEARALYEAYYGDHPFVVLSPSNPDLKQVVGTNKNILYLEKHQHYLLIISMIDNLLKGASGQAVQNMNLSLGLPEDTGLKLRALAF